MQVGHFFIFITVIHESIVLLGLEGMCCLAQIAPFTGHGPWPRISMVRHPNRYSREKA
jgi:hypothetical protein